MPDQPGEHEARNSTPAWERFTKMEPAVLRGFLVALSAVLALVLGKTVFDNSAIDTVLELYTSISALVAAFLIRPSVTANAKVVVWDSTPFQPQATVEPGEAVVEQSVHQQDAVLEAASRKAA